MNFKTVANAAFLVDDGSAPVFFGLLYGACLVVCICSWIPDLYRFCVKAAEPNEAGDTVLKNPELIKQ